MKTIKTVLFFSFVFVLLYSQLEADWVITKDGKKYEGTVTDKGDSYEVKTTYGVVKLSKNDVDKIIKHPKELLVEADKKYDQAREFFKKGVDCEKLDDRVSYLKKAILLLVEVYEEYEAVRKDFPQDDFKFMDEKMQEITEFMKLCKEKQKPEEKIKTISDEYKERYDKVDKNDTKELLKLSYWARDRGLYEEAVDLLNKIILIDPDHEEARALLGYVNVDGKWYTQDELQRMGRTGRKPSDTPKVEPIKPETKAKTNQVIFDNMMKEAVKQLDIYLRDIDVNKAICQAHPCMLSADECRKQHFDLHTGHQGFCRWITDFTSKYKKLFEESLPQYDDPERSRIQYEKNLKKIEQEIILEKEKKLQPRLGKGTDRYDPDEKKVDDPKRTASGKETSDVMTDVPGAKTRNDCRTATIGLLKEFALTVHQMNSSDKKSYYIAEGFKRKLLKVSNIKITGNYYGVVFSYLEFEKLTNHPANLEIKIPKFTVLDSTDGLLPDFVLFDENVINLTETNKNASIVNVKGLALQRHKEFPTDHEGSKFAFKISEATGEFNRAISILKRVDAMNKGGQFQKYKIITFTNTSPEETISSFAVWKLLSPKNPENVKIEINFDFFKESVSKILIYSGKKYSELSPENRDTIDAIIKEIWGIIEGVK